MIGQLEFCENELRKNQLHPLFGFLLEKVEVDLLASHLLKLLSLLGAEHFQRLLQHPLLGFGLFCLPFG
jgi:hypothetical protein